MLRLVRVKDGWERVWAIFAPHHYFHNTERGGFNKASYKFLVFEDDVVIGFAATLPMPSGSLCSAWRSHKTVVLPAYDNKWPQVSDFVAEWHVKQGKRFFCQAPYEFAKYRDEPNSKWMPTTAHYPPEKCSHEYREGDTLTFKEILTEPTATPRRRIRASAGNSKKTHPCV